MVIVFGSLCRSSVEFRPKISFTTAVNIVKGDEVGVEMFFPTSRRWLIEQLT